MSISMTRDPRNTIIDMTPDGGFRQTSAAPFWGIRARGVAVLVAIAAGLTLMMAVAVWLAITLVPVLLVVGLGVLLASRLKAWQRRRAVIPG